MDFTKTGLFIAQLRRAKGWTQAQLAQQLGVTDKAVSRWETGRGFPDVGILVPLAGALGVSVIELINGERAAAEIPVEQADAAVLDTLLRTRRMIRKMAGLLLLLFGVGTVAFRFLYIAGNMAAPVLVLGIGMALAGLQLMFVKQDPLQGRGRTKLPVCACCAVWLALLLELLPGSVRMAFAAGPGERIFQNVSYFSLLPFGYGNIFPFLTGCLTFGIALILLLLRLRGGGNAVPAEYSVFLHGDMCCPVGFCSFFRRVYIAYRYRDCGAAYCFCCYAVLGKLSGFMMGRYIWTRPLIAGRKRPGVSGSLLRGSLPGKSAGGRTYSSIGQGRAGTWKRWPGGILCDPQRGVFHARAVAKNRANKQRRGYRNDIPVFVCACPVNGRLIAFIPAFYIISVLPYLSQGHKAKEEYLTILLALNPTNRNGEVDQ